MNTRGLDLGIHFGEHEGYRRPVEFRVLGVVEVVERGNGNVSLGGPKQRAILAQLLLRANDLIPTEVLIDEVWGDEPPEAVRNALQTHTSHLRKALGPGRLEGSRAGYVLHVDPAEIDARRFESLLRDARRLLPLDPKAAVGAYDEALSLWHGPAFGDLAGEPSIAVEATRLDELRLGAIEDRIEALLTLGDHGGLIAELETLVARYPLRERFWAQLMLASYRAGRQAEALTAFQRAREILADELGIDPSPELCRLHERILQQSPDLDLEGAPLRGYRLLERVGMGSFGTVWRAIQPKVGRDVAVKAIHPHLSNDPDFIRRFETEAQIVARLEHPHIVPLYDYWREPGGAYLVMRFLRGGSLANAINRGPMDAERAARLIDQVSDALATAHQQGVVHRDVKPSNILLDHEGNAYLADFGIAKDLSVPDVTEPGGVKGSLLYLAPEQVRGEPATPRTDLYALGLILYEALVGRHPFADVPDLAVFERQLRDPLPPVSDQRPDLPPAINEVVVAATAKDPELRFPDTLAMAAALREAIASGTPVVPPPARVEPRNPYKGLRPFVEADSHDFFGREALVERFLEQWRDPIHPARFLAVVGPSGIGKSSAVRAGLVPAIRAGAIDGSESWFVTEMVPGLHPMEELESALGRIATRPPAGLLTLLESGPRGLVQAVERIVPDGAELVLVVDQFEEAFTLTDEAERALLLESLRVAAADPESRTRIVVTLRADFYDRPLNYPRFGELLGASSDVVTPLAPDELERAIVRPAESVGLRVEPALLAQIASDVAEQPGALPLVQYALTELSDRRNEGRLTLAAYRDIGGIAGALATRADQLYATRDQRGQEVVRQLLLRLVTLGEGVADTRRRVPLSELTAIGVEPELMQSAIEAFGHHRLLTFDRDPATREPTVEVAHEALLRSWPRLRGWIDATREDLRTLRRLADASREWERSGRDPSFLPSGSRLEQFETWVGGSDLAVGRAELGYLRAGATKRDEERAAELARQAHGRALERRSVRRLRALVVVFAAAALVAALLTAVATNQSGRAERESRTATARELAAAAVANLEVDPERSVLLAIQAVDTTRSADGSVLPEAEEALHRAVGASRVMLSVPSIGGHLDWSSKGVFVTEGPAGVGIVDIRDATTGERVLAFEGHNGDITDVAFSRDGSKLATTGEDGTLKVWNPSTGDLLASRLGDGTALGPSFSEDGSLVAAVWDNGDDDEVRVVDVSTGRTVWSRHRSRAADTALSPDGKHLAVTAIHRNGEVFDLETGGQAFEFGRGFDVAFPSIRGVSWSPGGRYIAITGNGGFPQIWDAETGKLLFKLQGHSGFVVSVAWSPSSPADKTSRLVTGGLEGTAKVWDIGSHGVEEVQSLSAQEMRSGIVGVAFSPDGSRVMAGNVDLSAVKVWDLGSNGDSEWANLPSSSGIFSAVDFLPDGRRVVATSGGGRALTVWDLRDGRPIREIATAGISNVYSVDVSPDGALIAAGGAGGSEPGGDVVGVWRTDTGEKLFGVKHRFDVNTVAFSPDGERLVTASWRGTAKIVDRSGRVIQILKEGHGYDLNGARFSPDGRLVATATVGGGGQVTIWNWKRGTVVRTMHDVDSVVDFDASGLRIVTVGQEGRTEIREVQSGKRVAVLPGLPGITWDVTFSPDGSLVAAAGDDGRVYLFDADTEERLVLPGNAGAIEGLDFSPDGTKLASSSTYDGVRIWALDIVDLLEIARQNVTRSLTNEECRQYLHMDACPTD